MLWERPFPVGRPALSVPQTMVSRIADALHDGFLPLRLAYPIARLPPGLARLRLEVQSVQRQREPYEHADHGTQRELVEDPVEPGSHAATGDDAAQDEERDRFARRRGPPIVVPGSSPWWSHTIAAASTGDNAPVMETPARRQAGTIICRPAVPAERRRRDGPGRRRRPARSPSDTG